MKNFWSFFLVTLCLTVTTTASAKNFEECTKFSLEKGDIIQKALPAKLTDAAWSGMKVYKLFSYLGKESRWEEVQSTNIGGESIYRFIAEQDSDAVICGQNIFSSGYRSFKKSEDLHLLLLTKENNVKLPSQFDKEGNRKYIFREVKLGYGHSSKLSMVHAFGDEKGEPVAIIIFSSNGFPQKILSYSDPILNRTWINPTELAIIINYVGSDWDADKKSFFLDIQKINYLLKNSI